MGRLPSTFAGRTITFRIPFIIPGELLVANAANGIPFPEATFLHNTDKPFEIHRFVPRLYPFSNDATPVPITITNMIAAAANPEAIIHILQHFVRMRIRDVSKNENLTKNAILIDGMCRDNEKTWEFEDPYTIVRAEGFEVTVDNTAPAAGTVFGAQTSTNVRVEGSFQGFLIVVAPPSETR